MRKKKLTEGWTTGGKGGDHWFRADGSALCNRNYKPGGLYPFNATAPARGCKRCKSLLANQQPEPATP